MRISRTSTVGIAGSVAAVAAMAIVVPAIGGTNERPRSIQLSTKNQSVTATTGSYCVNSTDHSSPEQGTGICADSFYPLKTHGRLRLKPGERFALKTHDRAIRSIRMNLIDVHGDKIDNVGPGFSASQRDGHPARWIGKLPEEPKGANVIDVIVRYKHGIGDADYWAGLEVR